MKLNILVISCIPIQHFLFNTCKRIMPSIKYFKREVKTTLSSPTGNLSKAIISGGIVAANKKVQRVMDTINDGTLLKRGRTSTVMMPKV